MESRGNVRERKGEMKGKGKLMGGKMKTNEKVEKEREGRA